MLLVMASLNAKQFGELCDYGLSETPDEVRITATSANICHENVSIAAMKILSISEPIIEFRYLNAGRGPGGFYVDTLPIHVAKVSELPAELAAMVVTADLQGRETFAEANGQPLRLLGEVLPQRLVAEVFPKLNLPAGRIGAVLAGDFYTVPALDKRGGSGDVTKVWHEFAYQFDWVVGVAGNHDLFGDQPSPSHQPSGNARVLDKQTVEFDSIRFAGVGGTIGNPKRLWRRTLEDYCKAIEQTLATQADVLVLHDGPDAADGSGKGSSEVRELLQMLPPTLVIRGHAHWKAPLAELANGTQVLNVDARCMILVEQ